MGKIIIKIILICLIIGLCIVLFDLFSEGVIDLTDWKYFVGRIDYDTVVEYKGSYLRADDNDVTYMINTMRKIAYRKEIDKDNPILRKFPRVSTTVIELSEEDIEWVKSFLYDSKYDNLVNDKLSYFYLYDKSKREEAYLCSDESQLGEFSQLWEVFNKIE